jgi:hypothetical protein
MSLKKTSVRKVDDIRILQYVLLETKPEFVELKPQKRMHHYWDLWRQSRLVAYFEIESAKQSC